VETCLSPFGDSGNLDASNVHGLCRMYNQIENHVGRTQMELLGEWVIWNLVLVRLETVLLSVQYRCRVCAERIIGSEFVLDAPDDTPR
jgi:hypothetical protein